MANGDIEFVKRVKGSDKRKNTFEKYGKFTSKHVRVMENIKSAVKKKCS